VTARHRRRYPRRRPDHRRTRRRVALAVVLLVIVAVIATALRSGSSSTNTTPALATTPSTQLAPNAPPAPLGLATATGNLVLDVPITRRRITAIVYHGVGTPQVVPLAPLGSQRNSGILNTIAKMLSGAPDGGGGPAYYIDGSGQGATTGSVDVGAVAGTAVYSPVDGKVTSIQPYVIDGTAHGSVISIQPTSTPADVVTLTNLGAVPGLAVGSTVAAAKTKLGMIVDLSKVLSQEMSKYTSDAGNHDHIEVGPALTTNVFL
jgi:hypothetical protein